MRIIAFGMLEGDSVGLLVYCPKFSKGLQPELTAGYMPDPQ